VFDILVRRFLRSWRHPALSGYNIRITALVARQCRVGSRQVMSAPVQSYYYYYRLLRNAGST